MWHVCQYNIALAVLFACGWAYIYFIGPSPARLVMSGCIRIEGSHSLQPALLARMHQSGRCWLLSSYTHKPVVSLVMWYYSIGPSPARLVLPGCIRTEGSHSLQPASLAFMHQSGCCSPFSSYTHKPVVSLVIRHHYIGPSPARLVLPGCIRIEGSHKPIRQLLESHQY